jgi:hypothetical protein
MHPVEIALWAVIAAGWASSALCFAFHSLRERYELSL